MNEKGFTLIEMLVGMVIVIIVMAAVYGVMEMGQRSSVTIGRKVVTQQDTRSVLDLMAMEVRMSSYAPDGAGKVTWQAFKTTCTDGVLIPANKGIQYADKNNIAIEMDLNNDHAVTGTNELIYYSYDANQSAILRQVGCNGPLTVILGGAGAETVVVNSLTNPAATPLFRYFDATDSDITNAVVADQTKIKDIIRIEITIVADTRFTDPRIKSVNRMIYSTSFIARNHVLN